MDCQCESAGYCPVFKMKMTKRTHDICRGHDEDGAPVLTPDRREKYQQLWMQQAGQEPPQPAPPPGILQMAANFAKAVKDFVARPGFVSAEQYKARLAICRTCEYLHGMRCKHPKCGCFVTAKAKAKSWTCPIGKWPKVGRHPIQEHP